jgi:hypothetical protein
MGRFATTAALYEDLRPPYPPAFFRSVAEKFALYGQSALIDLGIGPGLLALGFARLLSAASSSPEALGNNVDAMLREVEGHLAPFARGGMITETLVSVAQIIRR